MATHQEMIAIDIVIYKRMNTSIKCEEMIAIDIVISAHYLFCMQDNSLHL